MASLARSGLSGPLVIGLGGLAALLALGFWQVERLDWKRGIIAEAERRLAAPPVALPVDLDPARDDYRPVFVEGRFVGDELYHLTSRKPHGPGFDVIAPFETTDGRRILVERGYVPQAMRDPATRTPPQGERRVTGFLRWPDDVNVFTPDPDPVERIWYARNVPSLAAAAGTEPVMIVQAPTAAGGYPRGRAVAVAIRNNHRTYAVTWFCVAAIWLGMTLFWVRRLRLAPPATGA